MSVNYLRLFLIIVSTNLVFSHCLQTQRTSSNLETERLVWSDEFNSDGLPDITKWSYDLGNGCPNLCGWGNNEQQHYTNAKENARIEKGVLIIEARTNKADEKQFTSARLVSKHKGDWTYGRFEIRAKLPQGRGVWSAIWMLSTDWKYGGWPGSGEIDIMENVGYLPDSIYGTVHTVNYNHVNGTQVSGEIASSTLSSDFHLYGINWDTDKIEFYFDGKCYQTFKNDKKGFKSWPFDQDFHILLNVAVGGNWGGKMGVDTTIWPQRMEIDYIRVYQ